MAGSLFVRFRVRNHADIVQEVVPETGVEQVQSGMFHTAVVPVNRSPVFERFLACKRIVVVRVHIPKEVPGRSCPLGHRICLTFSGTTTAGAGGVNPVGMSCQRALAIFTRFKIGNLGQRQRQFALRNRLPAALLTLDHRDRFAPVTLTAKDPVAEFKVDLIASLAVCFQPFNHLCLCIIDRQAGDKTGVNQCTGRDIGKCAFVQVGRGVALNNLNDRQAEFLCKLPVTGIMCRNCHDCTGAVAGQDVVGNKDRNFLIIDRVDAHNTIQTNTGLVLVQLGTLHIALAGSFQLICLYFIGIFDDALFQPFTHQRMLRRNDHISRTKQGIAAGGIHRQGVTGCRCKVDFRTMAASNPVFLLGDDTVDIIQPVQSVDQTVCIGGDLQHPLALFTMDNRRATAFTDAIDDLFVGKDDLTAGTPVNVHFLFVSKTMLVQLEEDPLSPFIIIRVGGIDLTVPVKRKSQRFQLRFETSDVIPGDDLRMNMVLHRKVLSRQTERVPSHCIQDIVPFQTAFSRDDIQRGIAAGMTDMQTGARRIGKFYQRIEFGFGVINFSTERLILVPVALPLFLNGLKIVDAAHVFLSFLYRGSPHRFAKSQFALRR